MDSASNQTAASVMSSPNIPTSSMEFKASNTSSFVENSHKRTWDSSNRGRGRGDSRNKSKRDSRNRGGKGGRHKKQDMGRAEWSRNTVDKRARNDAAQGDNKRRKLNDEKVESPIYAMEYSKEEIEKEERKPKRKVAVMIGYSGSGYKGMQLNHHEKTIEGDLFSAFVAAGAISKANANDPKKSSLVRCARTDKGVHAAGNVISLKLIIEDPDIVNKINDNLSPQIRVWGIQRTNGSFSAYQLCDSRIYEYLIPTHCFLPPHPDSFLGKKMLELAEGANDREGLDQRQQEVSSFWAETEEKYIKPILDNADSSIRPLLRKALYEADTEADSSSGLDESAKAAASEEDAEEEAPTGEHSVEEAGAEAYSVKTPRELSPLEFAIKELKVAYLVAKKAYRIDPKRLSRIHSTLSRYTGTHNYHNYTIQKSFRDASAKRVIKTFLVDSNPIIINNTEWLSLKVHGQSFMMHQIRKMVGMAALVIRCGCHEGRIQDSYMADKYSIPKAPGLGLLLERPVFDTYNERLSDEYGREKVEFVQFEEEMEDFKQREIYERIFREEEREGVFHSFFTSIDNFKGSQLLYLSSAGIEATKKADGGGAADKQRGQDTIDDASEESDAEMGEG